MLVIVGESASGKSTTEKCLCALYGYKKIVSYTTRLVWIISFLNTLKMHQLNITLYSINLGIEMFEKMAQKLSVFMDGKKYTN